MDVKFSEILGPIKLVLLDTASKATTWRVPGKVIVPCKAGCAGCCSRHIIIYMAEAIIIYEKLKSDKRWDEVKTRAQAQLPIIGKTDPLSWFKLNISCPVLGTDKKCLVYQVRPAMCSTHFVLSDPKLCDPWGVGAGKYEPLDLDALYRSFCAKLENMVGSGVLRMRLPIPSALLLAEGISVQSGLNIQQVMAFVFKDL